MQWSDELKLVHGDSDPDNEGFSTPKLGSDTKVFANRKSVGFNEFFKAQQAGFTEQMKFDIFASEYEGQEFAVYEEKPYRILRTYENPKRPDELELTLSDLAERRG